MMCPCCQFFFYKKNKNKQLYFLHTRIGKIRHSIATPFRNLRSVKTLHCHSIPNNFLDMRCVLSGTQHRSLSSYQSKKPKIAYSPGYPIPGNQIHDGHVCSKTMCRRATTPDKLKKSSCLIIWKIYLKNYKNLVIIIINK